MSEDHSFWPRFVWNAPPGQEIIAVPGQCLRLVIERENGEKVMMYSLGPGAYGLIEVNNYNSRCETCLEEGYRRGQQDMRDRAELAVVTHKGYPSSQSEDVRRLEIKDLP